MLNIVKEHVEQAKCDVSTGPQHRGISLIRIWICRQCLVVEEIHCLFWSLHDGKKNGLSALSFKP